MALNVTPVGDSVQRGPVRLVQVQCDQCGHALVTMATSKRIARLVVTLERVHPATCDGLRSKVAAPCASSVAV